ncbi:competence/damage-inducible protein A [Thiohalospira sp.]|uniref:competence/damage-inducible protein A n=1 Tax=Thiohalospira sp. TaxID=3080549 RepID=UPI00397F9754
MTIAFGLVVVGDEILAGRRRDGHVVHIGAALAAAGHVLAEAVMVGDEPEPLEATLKRTRSAGRPTFVCGGIGATPDDLTRSAAAAAWGRPLVEHPEAVALLEARFGDAARPHRIRMAQWPEGAEPEPNPYNGIPGFRLEDHYFLPGFPEMAWPMVDAVLARDFPAGEPERVVAVRVFGVGESELVEPMEAVRASHPGVRAYSLPSTGGAGIELGCRGQGGEAAALETLLAAVVERGGRWEPLEGAGPASG